MRATLLALAAVALAACGGGATASSPPPNVALRVTVHDGHGKTSRATLTCGANATANGFLRDAPPKHCRSARRLARFLASPPDPNRACTEIYGGAQTARIAGKIGTSKVDRRFNRADGCGIDDWSRAKDLLGGVPR